MPFELTVKWSVGLESSDHFYELNPSKTCFCVLIEDKAVCFYKFCSINRSLETGKAFLVLPSKRMLSMLNSLEIKNFRTFQYLKLEGLRRVNLFAGKNNCGKTTLLEAIRIWAADGDSTVVNQILHSRGEFKEGWQESYEALFSRKYFEKGKHDSGVLKWEINDLNCTANYSKGKINTNYINFSLSNGNEALESTTPFAFPKDAVVFVPFSTENIHLDDFWKEIVLSPLENNVVEIMRTVEPRVERLAILNGDSRVSLEGEKPVSLKSLGDGAQRALVLGVALASAKDKILLIDEFESGLHYTVQDDLWKLIFKFSKKLNVQVFVTTHSEDSIRTFAQVAESQDDNDAAFFRLNKIDDETNATRYEPKELRFATEHQIEIRGL